MSKKGVWVVSITTESCDHHVIVFNEEPDDGHIHAYCEKNICGVIYPDPEEIAEWEKDDPDGFAELEEWEKEPRFCAGYEVDFYEIEDLPEPIEPYESL